MNNIKYRKHASKRRVLQWFLLFFVIIVIGFGWKYPLLGFIVPLVMLIGIIGGFINGRYVCGNICPRGAFFDRLLSLISRKKPFPSFIRHIAFRLGMMGFIFLFFIISISQNISSLPHWGFVFWQLCVITTSIAVVLGILYHQRSWCVFCPIGKIAGLIGGNKNKLQLDTEKCISCKLCEKVCPFQIEILKDAKTVTLENVNCLKCLEIRFLHYFPATHSN